MNQKELRIAQRRARWSILTLQLIVMAGLLYFAEISQARDDDDDGRRAPVCTTEECRRTSPAYNTIPIPAQYRSQPPDVGLWYRRGGDNSGQVWVPGLTDNMNDRTKGIYNSLKGQNHSRAWPLLRNQTAEILTLAQRYPSLRCQDNMAAARSGNVQMSCSYTDRGNRVTKTYDNLTTSQFDQHLDSQMETIAEVQDEQLRNGTTNLNAAHTNRAGEHGTRAGPGLSNASGGSSPYSRYINRHVAPHVRQVNRSTAAVFSSGSEAGVTLEEIQKKDSAEFSPSIQEGEGSQSESQSQPDESP